MDNQSAKLVSGLRVRVLVLFLGGKGVDAFTCQLPRMVEESIDAIIDVTVELCMLDVQLAGQRRVGARLTVDP